MDWWLGESPAGVLFEVSGSGGCEGNSVHVSAFDWGVTTFYIVNLTNDW